MKKLFFISAVISLLFLASCSNEEPAKLPVEYENNIETTNSESFKTFMLSVDSLNNSYTGVTTRGLWGNLGVSLADAAGRVGGRVLGKWLGASVGAAMANPAIACIGYLGGQHLGGVVGYAVASAAADLLFCNAGHPSIPKGNMQLIADYNIRPSEVIAQSTITRSSNIDMRCDSIGFYHNHVMMRVNQNKDQFISNGKVDMDRLYDAIIYYFIEVGVYSEPLAINNTIKKGIKQLAFDLAHISLSSIENSYSEALLMDIQCDYLYQHCLIPAEELDIYKEFTLSIASKCRQLSQEQIHSYASYLNTIIVNSNLPQDVKEEVAVSAMTTVNSALCWQQ